MTYYTLQDLAIRWQVNYNTLKVRRHRGQLAEPDVVLGNTPAWSEATVKAMEDNGQTRTGSSEPSTSG